MRRHAELLRQIDEAQDCIRQMASLNQTRFKNPLLLELCNKTYDLLEAMRV
jgi:hypothetical protein